MSHVTQGGSGDDDDDDDDDDANDGDDDVASTNLFLFLDNAIVRSPNAQRLRNVVLRGPGSYFILSRAFLDARAGVPIVQRCAAQCWHRTNRFPAASNWKL